MTAGYVVNENPSDGINSPTTPGAGQGVAIDWLNRLKALAQRLCVTPAVYAQADLHALERIGDYGLSAIATNDAGDIVDQILGVKSIRGATLLGDGRLSGPVAELLSQLAQQGQTVAIAAGDVTDQDSAPGEGPRVDLVARRYTPQLVGAPFDPTLGAALAGAGSDPSAPSYVDASLAVPVKHDSVVARRQDALSALLWRGLQPDAEPRTQIVMPPMVWDLGPDDAQAILTAAATSIHAGLAVPRPLTALIAESVAIPAQDTRPQTGDSVGNPNARFSDGVTAAIAGVTGRLWGLTAALTVDTRTGLTGMQYTAPLREDMLRALSQSVPPDARNGLAEQRIGTVGATVDDLFRSVTVVNPGGSYTLATERSPLPLALRNDLPVPIRVRLAIAAPPGMTVTDMGEIELPPGFLPLRVPIDVQFTQRVAVDVSLRTANGLPLGEPVRLSVHSNAYGKVLFFITLSAGAVLGAVGRATVVASLPRSARSGRPRPTDSAQHGAPVRSARHGHRSCSGRIMTSASSRAGQRHPQQLSDAAVVSRSWGMAFATLVSRITGFIRIVLLAAILGAALSSAFTVANQLPNLVAALVLEATFTAIFVPVLARAERDDPDGGTAFVRRLVTLATALLLVATVLSVVAAPLLVHLMLGEDPQVNRPLTTAFAYLLLPQVVFYGLSSVFMAILNTRNVFGPPAWAPVVNNVVAIATLLVYLAVPGELSVNPVEMGNAKLLVLGIGTTLGVFAQTAVLLVAIRRERVSLRPLWGLDDRLKRFGAMAAAMVLYVLISQAGLVVGNQIASTAAASGPAIYNYTWLVLMLPFGMIGVTVLTVVMPRLSRNAAADDIPAVLADLSLATRLTMVTLIPIVAFMTVGGPAIGSALFAYGNFGNVDAGYLGMAISLVGVHVDPLRAGAVAAARLLRARTTLDADRADRRHHRRQDRRIVGCARISPTTASSSRVTWGSPTAWASWPAPASATSCCAPTSSRRTAG